MKDKDIYAGNIVKRKCNKNFKEGNRKSKHDKSIKVKIVRSYINGVGFRVISRIFKIPLTTIFYFIKRSGE